MAEKPWAPIIADGPLKHSKQIIEQIMLLLKAGLFLSTQRSLGFLIKLHTISYEVSF